MRIGLAALLPVLCGLLGAAAPAADLSRLSVYRADVRFSGQRARLDLEADIQAAPGDGFETLRVTVGTTVVADASLPSDRAKARANDWGDLILRDPAHLGARQRLRLEYRPGSGYLRMRLSGFDGTALREAGPAAVPVLLEVSGREVRAAVAFVVLSPRRWTWRTGVHPRGGAGEPGGGGDPGTPPGPGDPPPPWPYGIRLVDYGGNSAITTVTKTVIRSSAALQDLWNRHKPGTTAPYVDFSKEMVFVYIAGPGQPTNRVGIGLDQLGGMILARGFSARNSFGDTGTSPYCMTAVARSDLPVTWN